jgi:DNA repair protein RadD
LKLRPYQRAAFEAAINEIRTTVDPCLIEAATGAGKSFIVSAIAKWVHDMSNKKVLCLAPSKELTEQNHEKFLLTGDKASFYSASIAKSMRHNVIFGTPQTVKNSIARFKDFAAVVVDEAHGITPTIKDIIEELRGTNPNTRVVGLTATPYRLGSGYIYGIDEEGRTVPEEETTSPYFQKLVYRITAHELIEAGFLTRPTTEVHDGYQTAHLELNSRGQFDAKEIDRAFVGHGRRTSKIIAEIVEVCQNRKGVMIFAASIKHAEECAASLPNELTRLVTGKTPQKEREKILADFKAKRIKYLVNVAVLTTGFDAPHVDCIAILRATESVSLLQQIIGRGLRIDDGKKDCLVLDYAENIQRHCPDGDIFDPRIEASKSKKTTGGTEYKCPQCSYENIFSNRPNPDGLGISENGYFMDLEGNELEMPSHFGRRCQAREKIKGSYVQCSYRWTIKECPDCAHENDIAARYCEKCRFELVDPNEKLREEFMRLKKDPSALTTDKVLAVSATPWTTNKGEKSLKVDFTTEYRTFPVWYSPKWRKPWQLFCHSLGVSSSSTIEGLSALFGVNKQLIKTISAKKENGFFKVVAYNKVPDEISERD